MPIVEPLKRFREQFRLTQNDVAEKLGIKQASYAQYEQKTKPSTPSADTIIKLARAYNVSADYLLGLTDTPQLFKTAVEFDEKESNELTVAAENDRILDYHQTLANILAKQGIKI